MANELRAVPLRAPGAAVTLVDSNVLFDVLTEDPTGLQWSEAKLAAARDRGVW